MYTGTFMYYEMTSESWVNNKLRFLLLQKHGMGQRLSAS